MHDHEYAGRIDAVKQRAHGRWSEILGPLVVPCGIEAQNHWSSSSPVGMWAGCI